MIGETIGNFRVVKRLGAGGMGEVFLAEHTNLQTPVAVKLLNKDISTNTDHVQRFFNEARIVSKIKSAGTVKIFDSGFHNEQAYLIMELLEGESLATRIKTRGAMPPGDAIDIARQISSVLDATHRQGVTHRDLKPDNIYIVHDDERASGERVKILDFGIAKLSGTLAVSSPKTKGTIGTPQYMAPEQWGDSSKVDWRADAYSLGCVLFEMLCGRPPFEPATIAEAYVMAATETPPTPSTLAQGIPPELDELVLRLLAKEPSDRAVSMGQIVRELAELAGEPPPSRNITPLPMAKLSPTPGDIARPLEGKDAIATAPAIPSAAPVTQPGPTRRASSHPAVTPTPTLAATTLGSSAAELSQLVSAPKKRPTVLLAGIGAAVVAAIVVTVVIMVGKDKPASPNAAGAPSTMPSDPQVTAPVVAAPPEPAAAPAAPVAPAPPADPAAAATSPTTTAPAAANEPTDAATTTTATTTAAASTTTSSKKDERRRHDHTKPVATTTTTATKTAATSTTTKPATTTTTTKPATSTTTTPPATTATPPATTTTAPATTDGAGSGSGTKRRFGGGRL